MGRVIRQTDARGNETSYTYDAVGRLTARSCGGVVTSYTYGTAGYDKERLVSEQTADRLISYAYNNKGLLSSETRSMTGETPVTFTYHYDGYGRLSSKDYPQGVTVNYGYDGNGNPVSSDIGGHCASRVCSEGQTRTVTYGGTVADGSMQSSPALVSNNVYDNRGYISVRNLSRITGGGSLHGMSFNFDGATGNLLSRTGMTDQQETFEYDDLDRLVRVRRNNVTVQELEYADNGNIEGKTGVGALYYEGQQPHAVSAADNTAGYIPSTSQQATYTAFGKVESLTEGAYGMTFTYGPDEERWKTVLRQNGTVIRSTFYAGDYERVTENGTTRHFYYLDNGSVYVIEGSQPAGSFYCAFTDHLGSVTRIFSESGTSVFEAEYDAWGKQTVTTNTIGFHRGYTGHEMLPEFGLINMNGRLYDPMLGRFLSPDNYVQMPDFSQSFNRYSYCINNPLKYNDPDGEVWWLVAALIGGAINVAMNIDNIDNGWDFLGYFGVGAASAAVGLLGYGVGSAIAGKFVVGGFVSGAISGLTGGLSSGFVLGGGNSLVANGNFDGFLESALTGAVIGGVTGAVIGGVVGGYSAYKQGNNFWTGKPNSIAPQVELNYEEMDKLAPKYTTSEFTDNNNIELPHGLSDRSLQDAKYDVTYHTNASYGKTEGVNNTFSRPTIKGYNELQLSKPGHQDLYHNFPRMIDDVVVQHGYPLSPSPTNGGTMYVLPGHINGAPGYFGIKINNAGIIYHRHFVPLSRAGSMY